MKKYRISEFINFIKAHLSDVLTSAVGTWSFIISYTLLILAWIYYHRLGILSYDSNLIYLNFFLCWLSGIQASIVMMSDNRKVNKHFADTKKDLEISEQSLAVDLKNKELIRKMTVKVTSMVSKINKLEEIIAIMETEEQEKIHGKSKAKGKTKHREDN